MSPSILSTWPSKVSSLRVAKDCTWTENHTFFKAFIFGLFPGKVIRISLAQVQLEVLFVTAVLYLRYEDYGELLTH